jgi:hypothetical protein
MNQRENKKKTYVKTAVMSAAVIFSVLAFAVGSYNNNNIASASSSEEQQHKEVELRSQIYGDSESCHDEIIVAGGEDYDDPNAEPVEKNAENDAKAEVVMRAEEPAQDGSRVGEVEPTDEPCPLREEVT